MAWWYLLGGLLIGGGGAAFFFMQKESRHLLENARLSQELSHLQAQKEGVEQRHAESHSQLIQVQQQLQDIQNEAIRYQSQLEESTKYGEASKVQWESLWKENLQHFLSQELSQTREQLQKLMQHEDDARHQRFTGLVEPVKQMLDAYQHRLEGMNKDYATQIGIVNNQVTQLILSKDQLVSVLKHNKGSGTWGEIQLERILEASGLQKGIHFESQTRLEGSRGIPDVVVKMPENRYVIVDCKTLQWSNKPLQDFEQDPDASTGLTDAKALIKSIRDAVKSLNSKDYLQNNTQQTPDFVVLFLPKESMLSQALEEDPDLWQMAWDKHVLLSSPMTLIALLRMIYMGWNQHTFSQNMEDVKKLGLELHERLIRMADTLADVDKKYQDLGKSLDDLNTKHHGGQGVLKTLEKLERNGIKSSKSLSKDALNRLKEAEEKDLNESPPQALECS
jgi:DNA recombination protein RmuC